MKFFLFLINIFLIISFAKAQNTNITLSTELILNCKFKKVILKNEEYNFQTFLKDQIKRKDINKLTIVSKSPDILIVKNLSEFLNNNEFKIKISNKDIFLIQAFDENKNYSESAVYTRKTGELIHEITTNVKQENKGKDISFYSCTNNNKNNEL